jgi:ferredoxin
VYAQGAAGQVQVAQPRNCKTNCPACARICPEVAIIFPKYVGGAICGEEIVDEAGEREKARQRAALMRGTDPYTALQNRRRPGQVRLLADPEPPQT